MSTSIVHDLRNPLAAIYGGAEMLVDDDLSKEQVRRPANNIYPPRARKRCYRSCPTSTRGPTAGRRAVLAARK